MAIIAQQPMAGIWNANPTAAKGLFSFLALSIVLMPSIIAAINNPAI
jgi:hypothetical protein